MGTCFKSQHHCWAGLLLFLLSTSSCNEPANKDATIEHIDTISVKKLTSDSNSEMPIAKPKDSTKRIPNPYDAGKN